MPATDGNRTYGQGVLDKCNGRAPRYIRDDGDIDVIAYFEAYDNAEVVIPGEALEREELEIEFEPETVVFHYNTGDDLAEGMFDEGGQLLGAWSPNDCYWSDYFNDFMQRLNINVQEGDEETFDRPLREWAMEEWGLTAEEAGLI